MRRKTKAGKVCASHPDVSVVPAYWEGQAAPGGDAANNFHPVIVGCWLSLLMYPGPDVQPPP
eukprot:scaffold218640_cov19-Prasinocladus_malaysianus.AAC.1